METLQSILIFVHVIIALFIIIVVLLQKSDKDSLAGIGGSNSGAGTIKTSDSSLNKFTATLILIFMVNSLILAKLAFVNNSDGSKLEIDSMIEQKDLEKNDQKPKLPKID
jgi:preprotein translocase subunit SecG